MMPARSGALMNDLLPRRTPPARMADRASPSLPCPPAMDVLRRDVFRLDVSRMELRACWNC